MGLSEPDLVLGCVEAVRPHLRFLAAQLGYFLPVTLHKAAGVTIQFIYNVTIWAPSQ